MSGKCPICFSLIGYWEDDPILTPEGLAGDEYKGLTYVDYRHIVRLMEQKRSDEIAAAVASAEKTDWDAVEWPVTYDDSPDGVDNTDLYSVNLEHIQVLRNSTEKTLNALGISKYEYFNYDKEGNYMGTNQVEWTDLDLSKIRFVKSMHIEELRHLIYMGWAETYNKTIGYPYGQLEVMPWLPYYSIWTNRIFDHKWSISANGSYSAVDHNQGDASLGGGYEIIGDESNKKLKWSNWATARKADILWDWTLLSAFSEMKLTANSTLKTSGSWSYSGSNNIGNGYYTIIYIWFSNTGDTSLPTIHQGVIMYITVTPGLIGSMWTSPHKMKFLPDITNLNRNLYNDFVSIYGTPGENVKIKGIRVFSSFDIHPGHLPVLITDPLLSAYSETILDYIKIR